MKRLVSFLALGSVILGTSAAFAAPTKLLIKELMAAPTQAEHVVINNPGTTAVALDNYWLSDMASYYKVASGTSAPGSSDFLVRFPPGSTIAAGADKIIALHPADCFKSACGTTGTFKGFGRDPDFELPTCAAMPPPSGCIADNSTTVPDMLGTYGGANSDQQGLTNGGEPLVLFYWDGVATTVTHIDYVFFGTPGNTDNALVNKTGVAGYQPDAATGTPVPAFAPPGSSLVLRLQLPHHERRRSARNGLERHQRHRRDERELVRDLGRLGL